MVPSRSAELTHPQLSKTPGDDATARLARANGALLLSLCGGPEAAAGTTVLEDQAAQGSSLARFLLRLSQWVLAEQQELAASRQRRGPQTAGGGRLGGTANHIALGQGGATGRVGLPLSGGCVVFG